VEVLGPERADVGIVYAVVDNGHVSGGALGRRDSSHVLRRAGPVAGSRGRHSSTTSRANSRPNHSASKRSQRNTNRSTGSTIDCSRARVP
jgi:hypothetical protein